MPHFDNGMAEKSEITDLEFVILCNHRWLIIEVTARQKSVFPRCNFALCCGAQSCCALSFRATLANSTTAALCRACRPRPRIGTSTCKSLFELCQDSALKLKKKWWWCLGLSALKPPFSITIVIFHHHHYHHQHCNQPLPSLLPSHHHDHHYHDHHHDHHRHHHNNNNKPLLLTPRIMAVTTITIGHHPLPQPSSW